MNRYGIVTILYDKVIPKCYKALTIFCLASTFLSLVITASVRHWHSGTRYTDYFKSNIVQLVTNKKHFEHKYDIVSLLAQNFLKFTILLWKNSIAALIVDAYLFAHILSFHLGSRDHIPPGGGGGGYFVIKCVDAYVEIYTIYTYN
jgi:hypothetical protein